MSARPLARAPVLLVAAKHARNPPYRPIASCLSFCISDAPIGAILDTKLKELKYSLSVQSNPSRVWSQYTGLLNHLRQNNLPLEIHQQVLRSCTPPSTELRSIGGRRLRVENQLVSPHIHEGRLQAVVRAIRALGMTPDLEDYHFILEQFAAVGHHVGVMRVYKELLDLGLEPKPKTFGLCFQAIAHRLTLPILEIDRPRLVVQTKKMTTELLSGMQKYLVPFTSVNLDLCMRILKETLDWDGFDCLMKWGYGIDISNPDRVPLEYSGIENRETKPSIPDVNFPALPAPLPFSTAALNTAMDMLGRFGDVSKLVQSFEVLTQPLPQANQHFFSSFDDDDFGVPVPASVSFTPPFAEPNTTTFSILIRHLSRMGHATLARHYILQLMELDAQNKHSLRVALRKQPLDTITAPRIAVNRGALIPAFGESNRDKNVGLMRWLNTKLPKIVRKKRAELEYFKRLRKELVHTREYERVLCAVEHPTPTTAGRPISESPLKRPPSSSLPPFSRNMSSRISRDPVDEDSVFNVDLDREPIAPFHPIRMSERKPLDINVHIRILERDWQEIKELADQVDDILGRTIQRVKERLGRRVWGNKDIYTQTDGCRLHVTKDMWTKIANFRPRRGYIVHHASGHPSPPNIPRSSLQGQATSDKYLSTQ